jgi:hypothetical protein
MRLLRSRGGKASAAERSLAAGQGMYFLGTGLWSLLHRRSFEAVSGTKVDYWLVRTVGVLICSTGLALSISARREAPAGELRLLALTSAAGLAAIDVAYVAAGRIRRVYLADAALESLLVAGWLRSLRT